jgi:hypothetical protein
VGDVQRGSVDGQADGVDVWREVFVVHRAVYCARCAQCTPIAMDQSLRSTTFLFFALFFCSGYKRQEVKLHHLSLHPSSAVSDRRATVPFYIPAVSR